MSSRIESHSSTELTPLSDRLAFMLVVRMFMAATVLVAARFLVAVPLHHYAVTAAECYMGFAVTFELLHRWLQRITNHRWLWLINLLLIVDGVFVAFVLTCSGQTRSPFLFLAYAHVVSVTLLVSFRTGLKVALWHSILLLSNYYLALAGTIEAWGIPQEQFGQKLSNELSVASATALLLVAIVTASFASLNERELRRRKGELTIIADLSGTIEQTRRPSEILQTLVDSTVQRMNCERAVAVTAHNGAVMVVGGMDNLGPINGDTISVLGGVLAKVAETHESLAVRVLDPEDDKTLVRVLPDAHNLSIIPLIAEGEVVAALVAEWGSARKRRVTRPMVGLLHTVAGRVALSLSNTFLLAEVQRLASVDGLTGLPNRRTFDTALERELSRSARTGQPVSLVMLDIDHFKAVNDSHGHQTGDQVLAESASGVIGACRSEDLPARYGGEEIVVIMPNCSADQALAAAERIRAALGVANTTLPGTSASAGVATFPTHASDVTSLLTAADEALYQSKAHGRNCSTMSTRNVEPAVEPADDPAGVATA